MIGKKNSTEIHIFKKDSTRVFSKRSILYLFEVFKIMGLKDRISPVVYGMFQSHSEDNSAIIILGFRRKQYEM